MVVVVLMNEHASVVVAAVITAPLYIRSVWYMYGYTYFIIVWRRKQEAQHTNFSILNKQHDSFNRSVFMCVFGYL